MGEHRNIKDLRKRLIGRIWEVEGLPIPWWYWTIRDPRIGFVRQLDSSSLGLLACSILSMHTRRTVEMSLCRTDLINVPRKPHPSFYLEYLEQKLGVYQHSHIVFKPKVAGKSKGRRSSRLKK